MRWPLTFPTLLMLKVQTPLLSVHEMTVVERFGSPHPKQPYKAVVCYRTTRNRDAKTIIDRATARFLFR